MQKEKKEQLIEKLAKLARIKLDKKEQKLFEPQLTEVLKAFKKIDIIDTKNIEPAFLPIQIKNILREDKAVKSLSQAEVFANTKHKEKVFFKGPRIEGE